MDSMIAWFQFCFDASWFAPVCRPLWSNALLFALVMGALLFIMLLRRMVLDIRRRRAADREEARRAFVDVDAIEQIRWSGDQLKGNPELNPDLARLIRAHVKSSVRDREPLPTLNLDAGIPQR